MKLNEKPFYLSEKDIEWVRNLSIHVRGGKNRPAVLPYRHDYR